MVPRRRRNRTSEAPGEPDEGIAVHELLDRHLLLVPSTVDFDRVSELVRDRLPGTDLAGTGFVAFGRHSRLIGPFELSMEDAVDAGVPMPWTLCYCLEAPVEREDPPLDGLDDRDGFAYAFPEGLPWRDEGRALHLLVALARRLQGAVRVAGTLRVIMPDPDRAVDHVVHSPVWLDPGVLLGVISRELPGARLAVEGSDWSGPPPEAYSGAAVADVLAADPLSAEELRELHSMADRVDLEVLGGEHVIDAFAVVGDLGADGVLEILVHLRDGDEPATAREPWAHDEFFSYEVRWSSVDPAERELRYPGEAFLASRARVARLAKAVTRSIVEATSGIVVDEDGFRVDRYEL